MSVMNETAQLSHSERDQFDSSEGMGKAVQSRARRREVRANGDQSPFNIAKTPSPRLLCPANETHPQRGCEGHYS